MLAVGRASNDQTKLVAVIFGLVNVFVRPIIRLLSLPVTIFTLGLFTFVINALMLTAVLAGSAMSIEGSRISQSLSALIGSIVIRVASTVIGWVMPNSD